MESTPREIDTSVPHSARIWNYWLGGKDNYTVDRAAGEQFLEIFFRGCGRGPGRLGVSTRRLPRRAGIRQFLDVTGLPTA